MKKPLLVIAQAAYVISASPVFAIGEEIDIKRPGVGISPDTNLGTIIGNILTIIIVVAVLAVLFMLIWGAFEWITSGGDKEGVARARNRILNALVGLVIIAIAFVLVRVIGNIVNINILNLNLPSLDQP